MRRLAGALAGMLLVGCSGVSSSGLSPLVTTPIGSGDDDGGSDARPAADATMGSSDAGGDVVDLAAADAGDAASSPDGRDAGSTDAADAQIPDAAPPLWAWSCWAPSANIPFCPPRPASISAIACGALTGTNQNVDAGGVWTCPSATVPPCGPFGNACSFYLITNFADGGGGWYEGQVMHPCGADGTCDPYACNSVNMCPVP